MGGRAGGLGLGGRAAGEPAEDGVRLVAVARLHLRGGRAGLVLLRHAEAERRWRMSAAGCGRRRTGAGEDGGGRPGAWRPHVGAQTVGALLGRLRRRSEKERLETGRDGCSVVGLEVDVFLTMAVIHPEPASESMSLQPATTPARVTVTSRAPPSR